MHLRERRGRSCICSLYSLLFSLLLVSLHAIDGYKQLLTLQWQSQLHSTANFSSQPHSLAADADTAADGQGPRGCEVALSSTIHSPCCVEFQCAVRCLLGTAQRPGNYRQYNGLMDLWREDLSRQTNRKELQPLCHSPFLSSPFLAQKE